MNLEESAIIERLAAIFATSDPRIHVGIGDDGAVVATTASTAVTTDMAVEGVHFSKEWSSAKEIGGKVCLANLADLYAMGADPDYLVVSVALTGNEEIEWIEDLAQGIVEEAKRAGAHVVGGDLVRGAQVVISIAAFGRCDKAITRTGASLGDSIYLSSLPGWSRAGYEQLRRGLSFDPHAISEFKRPTFDYDIALAYQAATSMCDISDAFIVQGAQMTKSYAFQIDPELIECSPEFSQLHSLAIEMGEDVWSWILGGGEDHVLLATGRDLPGIRIGEVVEGSGILGLEMKKAPDTWRHFT